MGNTISNILNSSNEINELIIGATELFTSMNDQISELIDFKNEFELKKLARYIIISKYCESIQIETNIKKNNIAIEFSKIDSSNSNYEYRKIKYYPDTIEDGLIKKYNIKTTNIEGTLNLFKQLCPNYESFTIDETYEKLKLLLGN